MDENGRRCRMFGLRLLSLLLPAIPAECFTSGSVAVHHHPTSTTAIRGISSSTRGAQELRQQTTSEEELVGRFASLRTLGVDYGLTRTGVAVTFGGYRPRPLAILSGLNNTELATALVDYVQSEQATNIVLGLPLNKNGTASKQSLITRDFGRALLSEVRSRCGPGIPIQLWDERYTSKEAASRITAEAMARNQRIPSASDLANELDAEAACIILEDYYKELGKDAEELQFDDESIENECQERYELYLEAQERRRLEMAEERDRQRNARKEMIEQARAMEEASGLPSSDKKKKKKKKRKKKR